MDFPRLVYKSASNHKPVASAEQLDAALADGWSGSVPEALAAEAITAKMRADVGSTIDSKPPTRGELEQKATELGLTFSARVSDKRLAEAITARLAK